jgi:hypothetical protein
VALVEDQFKVDDDPAVMVDGLAEMKTVGGGGGGGVPVLDTVTVIVEEVARLLEVSLAVAVKE